MAIDATRAFVRSSIVFIAKLNWERHGEWNSHSFLYAHMSLWWHTALINLGTIFNAFYVQSMGILWAIEFFFFFSWMRAFLFHMHAVYNKIWTRQSHGSFFVSLSLCISFVSIRSYYEFHQIEWLRINAWQSFRLRLNERHLFRLLTNKGIGTAEVMYCLYFLFEYGNI